MSIYQTPILVLIFENTARKGVSALTEQRIDQHFYRNVDGAGCYYGGRGSLKTKSSIMTEKTQPLAEQELDQTTGGDSAEYYQDPNIRHKYQCPKCNGTSFKRGKETIDYWPLKRKIKEWLECTTCGAHYPINGQNSLIMLD